MIHASMLTSFFNNSLGEGVVSIMFARTGLATDINFRNALAKGSCQS